VCSFRKSIASLDRTGYLLGRIVRDLAGKFLLRSHDQLGGIAVAVLLPTSMKRAFSVTLVRSFDAAMSTTIVLHGAFGDIGSFPTCSAFFGCGGVVSGRSIIEGGASRALIFSQIRRRRDGGVGSSPVLRLQTAALDSAAIPAVASWGKFWRV